MSTADTVQTAASIMNKGRKPPKRGISSGADAKAILDKGNPPETEQNPTPNFASEFPTTNPPSTSMPITNLVDIFNRVLVQGS